MDEKENFSYDGRYNTSKLLNVLWAREFASKVKKSEVIINTVNLSMCRTSLHQDDGTVGINIFKKIFARTPAQGAHCLLDAAVVGKGETHGGYLSEQRSIP